VAPCEPRQRSKGVPPHVGGATRARVRTAARRAGAHPARAVRRGCDGHVHRAAARLAQRAGAGGRRRARAGRRPAGARARHRRIHPGRELLRGGRRGRRRAADRHADPPGARRAQARTGPGPGACCVCPTGGRSRPCGAAGCWSLCWAMRRRACVLIPSRIRLLRQLPRLPHALFYRLLAWHEGACDPDRADVSARRSDTRRSRLTALRTAQRARPAHRWLHADEQRGHLSRGGARPRGAPVCAARGRRGAGRRRPRGRPGVRHGGAARRRAGVPGIARRRAVAWRTWGQACSGRRGVPDCALCSICGCASLDTPARPRVPPPPAPARGACVWEPGRPAAPERSTCRTERPWPAGRLCLRAGGPRRARECRTGLRTAAVPRRPRYAWQPSRLGYCKCEV